MKYKRGIIITGFVLAVLSGLYIYFQDNLPPRTPYKIARVISGLGIRNDFKVSVFDDNLHGEEIVSSGELFIEFTLDDKQFEFIKDECIQKKYQNLPIKDFLFTPDFIEDTDNGLYMLDNSSSDPLNYTLVVLKHRQKKLQIYLSES